MCCREAIAALHDEAERAEDTDWPQIAALDGGLDRLAPDPLLTINRAVAVAAVHGPRAGPWLPDPLLGDSRVARHHRLHAARLTTSLPEQQYLPARLPASAEPLGTGVGTAVPCRGTAAPRPSVVRRCARPRTDREELPCDPSRWHSRAGRSTSSPS